MERVVETEMKEMKMREVVEEIVGTWGGADGGGGADERVEVEMEEMREVMEIGRSR